MEKSSSRINERGFTMIELVVSIAIMVLLTSTFLANYSGANQSSELVLSAQKLASDLRLMQNNTLGLKDFQGASPGGWGVHFIRSGNGYELFADAASAQDYKLGIGESYQVIDLPRGITITNLYYGGSMTDSLDIVFVPPDPLTFISDDIDISSTTNATINLSDSKGITRSIKINFLGLIEVE